MKVYVVVEYDDDVELYTDYDLQIFSSFQTAFMNAYKRYKGMFPEPKGCKIFYKGNYYDPTIFPFKDIDVEDEMVLGRRTLFNPAMQIYNFREGVKIIAKELN